METHVGRIHLSRRSPALAVAVTALVAATAAAGCGSSGTEPTMPATQPPPKRASQPRTFISRRYGFRVTLSGAWSEHDASVDWNGKHLQGVASPAFANFPDAATGRTLVVGAAPVANGTGLAGWRVRVVRAAPSVCSDSSPVEETTLGGEPAVTWSATCSDGYNVEKLAALHGRRGYIVLLASQMSNGATEDHRIFESIRRSFRFGRAGS
jgi:hypothetical protein